jgi:hypothetical protein
MSREMDIGTEMFDSPPPSDAPSDSGASTRVSSPHIRSGTDEVAVFKALLQRGLSSFTRHRASDRAETGVQDLEVLRRWLGDVIVERRQRLDASPAHGDRSRFANVDRAIAAASTATAASAASSPREPDEAPTRDSVATTRDSVLADDAAASESTRSPASARGLGGAERRDMQTRIDQLEDQCIALTLEHERDRRAASAHDARLASLRAAHAVDIAELRRDVERDAARGVAELMALRDDMHARSKLLSTSLVHMQRNFVDRLKLDVATITNRSSSAGHVGAPQAAPSSASLASMAAGNAYHQPAQVAACPLQQATHRPQFQRALRPEEMTPPPTFVDPAMFGSPTDDLPALPAVLFPVAATPMTARSAMVRVGTTSHPMPMSSPVNAFPVAVERGPRAQQRLQRSSSLPTGAANHRRSQQPVPQPQRQRAVQQQQQQQQQQQRPAARRRLSHPEPQKEYFFASASSSGYVPESSFDPAASQPRGDEQPVPLFAAPTMASKARRVFR